APRIQTEIWLRKKSPLPVENADLDPIMKHDAAIAFSEFRGFIDEYFRHQLPRVCSAAQIDLGVQSQEFRPRCAARGICAWLPHFLRSGGGPRPVPYDEQGRVLILRAVPVHSLAEMRDEG